MPATEETEPGTRNRKLTEKGREYKHEQYNKIFRTLRLTSGAIRQLISDNESPETVRKKYASWLDDYEHFLVIFDELVPQFTDKNEKEELLKAHYDYDVFLMNFKKEIEEFFSKHQSVKEESQKSKSHTSIASSISSKRLEEEQRKELELAKVKLKLEEEELDLNTNIAIANAKTEVLQKYERYEDADLRDVDSYIDIVNPRTLAPKPTPKTPLFHSDFASVPSLFERPLNPNAETFTPKREEIPPLDLHCLDIKTKPQISESDAIQCVVQYLRKPVAEIRKFGGNPLEYRRFIRQFNTKVVTNTKDNDERMNYLEQLTFGEAHRVVSGFSHMSGDRAYTAAMNQLEERYGDNEVIATAFIKKALDWPAVKDAKMLDEFSLFLVECQNAAESIDSVSVLDYSDNIKRLMTKLPVYMHDRWRNVVLKTKETKKTVKFKDFVSFVKTEAKKSNDPTYGNASIGGNSKNQDRNQKRAVASTDVTSEVHVQDFKVREQKCEFCESSTHALNDCKKFVTKGLQDRYNFLRNNGQCYGCLRKGHVTKKCKARLQCSICSRRHPTILHDPTKCVAKPTDEENINPVSTDVKTTCKISKPQISAFSDKGAGETTCAMAIIPVRVKLKNKPYSIETYAFFDSGSSVSFCTENIMHRLGASGKKKQITIKTMGDSQKLNTYVVSGLQVCGLSMEHIITLPNVYTKECMPVSKEHIPTQQELKQWPHLSTIQTSEIDAEIGIMIGNNVPDAYSPFEVIAGPSGSPHATRTRLGWIVWNVIRENASDTFDVNRVAIEDAQERDRNLEKMVKDSINYDFPERLEDDVKENSLEDKSFLTQVSESIHIRDGHHSIGLPFKDPLIQLPNNIMQGFQRLESLKKKLIRDPKVRNDYVTFMNKLFEKGYAEPVPQSQLQREDGRVWYLPHHGVYNDKKPGKIRVVFDCSAVYMGISLNSQLLQGPDLTNSLLGVLLRFRQEKVAIQGDIEAMFHQVSIPEQDRDCLRFLWWKDGNLDASPEQYRMKVHIFGATSSPTCCNYALQQTAKEYGSDFDPTVVTTVLRNMYVDDCLSSVDTEKKAALLIEDLSTLCSKGGFHLTKWISNSKQVLESVPEEDRAKDVQKWNLEGESETLVERALGVYWLVNSDRLGFLINIKNQPTTRRGILSIVSSIFDPLGIVSPFVMTAKTLLQKMCKNSVGWDEEITGSQLKDWKNWLTQAKELENVTLERCYKPQDFEKTTCQELHCFADASEVGIGVVIYLRLISNSKQR
ncbi:uncharacterized protein LOC134282740 [Saccostrea cucullata]|uniref:uncharacterized protein LOC134282740 n=1 Tax=Saccostrea cuccullata TaxID=36930 RepID=UPI002ED563A6